MASKDAISILIPVYNSGRMAKGASRKILATLTAFPEVELLFGNDGSADDSFDHLQRLQEKVPQVRVFTHENRGLGFTLVDLINQARGRICVYLDIDLSFDISRLPDLIRRVGDYDIAVASKYCGDALCCLPWSRRLCSRLYYRGVKLFTGISVKDLGSGMIAFDRKRIADLGLTSEGFNIHAELFHKAARRKYRVCEEPIPYDHSQEGSFRIIKHGIPAVRDFIVYALSQRS